jgi:predicted ATP-grasp superfamily ATP-dependent carboligase
MRPAVVLGLLHAGLALARSLGRGGVPVEGLVLHRTDFGQSSRYLSRSGFANGDEALLKALRGRPERPVVFPERDQHVEALLRRWDEVRELADVPLPDDAEVTTRLRRKEVLPELAAAAGVPAPHTVEAGSEAAIRAAGLQPPFLVKPAEGQEFALTFGHKVVVAETEDEAVAAWSLAREHGFDTIVQELIPGSHERVHSLFTYIGRDGEPLGAVVGRKVRQGPLRFGTSAVFESHYDPHVEELGLQLLSSVGYRGFAHVEFAHDPRDGQYKLLEVNTRLPVWAGLGLTRRFDLGLAAYRDLCGDPVAPLGRLEDGVSWIYLGKDVYVSAQMARRRELGPRGFLRPYVRGKKVRATWALDDPRPALASLRYLASRA